MAQNLNEKPGRIATGSASCFQGLFRCLNTRLHSDQVRNVVPDLLVQADEEIDGPWTWVLVFLDLDLAAFWQLAMACRRCFRTDSRNMIEVVRTIEQLLAETPDILPERRRQGKLALKGLEFVGERWIVAEGEVFGLGLEEKVEGVVNRHLGNEIDFDGELARLFWEDETGVVVRLRVLLPIDEVVLRRDLHRVAEDLRPAVGCRFEPDDLRAELHRTVINVASDVAEGDVDGHGLGKGSESFRF